MAVNKRTMMLGGVLVLLLAYAVPNVFMKDSTSEELASTATSSPGVNSQGIQTGNKTETPKTTKAVSGDKLDVNNLKKRNNTSKQSDTTKKDANQENTVASASTKTNNPPATNTDKVANTTSGNKNPFASEEDIKKQNEKIAKDKEKEKKVQEAKQAKPKPVETAKPAKKKRKPNFKVKAIANTDSRSVAIIETGSQRITAFVGTTLNDGWTVTSINDGVVELQDETGEILAIDISK